MSKNYKNNSKWAVRATDFEADLFTQGFVSQHTILAAVTVGCPSNGQRASSISDLLAPAAKAAPAGPPATASHGRLCCSAGLSAPYYTHRWPGRTQSTASLLRKKMIPPTDIWGAPVGRLTCGRNHFFA